MRTIFLGLLLMTTMQAHAAWLYACAPGTEPDASGRFSSTISRPDGSSVRIGVVEQRPTGACSSRQLPFPLASIDGIRPINRQIADIATDRMLVTGSATAQGFAISTVEPVSPATGSVRSAIPLGANLLPRMTLRPYGVEERVQARMEEDKLVVTCTAGQKPAGVLLLQDWYIPRVNAHFLLQGSATAAFELHVSDAGQAARESSTLIGRLDGQDMQTWRRGIDDVRFDPQTWRSFSIACPQGPGTLTLKSLQLQPEQRPIPDRATWIWNPSAWLDEPRAVLDLAERHAVRTLFISISVRDGDVQYPDQLASFIRLASSRHIRVWSVDGDARMVLPDEHAAAVKRVTAYRVFNEGADPDARLAGVQFDVEPYLLPGYDLAEEEWNNRYIALVGQLKRAAGTIPIDMVVPYWWADRQKLMQAVATNVTSLTVMDYRTNADDILRFGAPFLDWGKQFGKRVRIALEAGPVDKETVRHYTRAKEGQLSFVALGETTVAVLTRDPHAALDGSAYMITSSTELDGSATSFNRNSAGLAGLLPMLEARFSAWDSFGGMALHELK